MPNKLTPAMSAQQAEKYISPSILANTRGLSLGKLGGQIIRNLSKMVSTEFHRFQAVFYQGAWLNNKEVMKRMDAIITELQHELEPAELNKKPEMSQESFRYIKDSISMGVGEMKIICKILSKRGVNKESVNHVKNNLEKLEEKLDMTTFKIEGKPRKKSSEKPSVSIPKKKTASAKPHSKIIDVSKIEVKHQVEPEDKKKIPKKVSFSDTIQVFGNPTKAAHREEMKLQPITILPKPPESDSLAYAEWQLKTLILDTYDNSPKDYRAGFMRNKRSYLEYSLARVPKENKIGQIKDAVPLEGEFYDYNPILHDIVERDYSKLPPEQLVRDTRKAILLVGIGMKQKTDLHEGSKEVDSKMRDRFRSLYRISAKIEKEKIMRPDKSIPKAKPSTKPRTPRSTPALDTSKHQTRSAPKGKRPPTRKPRMTKS